MCAQDWVILGLKLCKCIREKIKERKKTIRTSSIPNIAEKPTYIRNEGKWRFTRISFSITKKLRTESIRPYADMNAHNGRETLVAYENKIMSIGHKQKKGHMPLTW